MIAIPGSNPIGNVLHLILGPESELISDIHGATIMDITAAINKFVTEKPVFVSVSRCKSESETIKNLNNVHIEHISSFGSIAKEGACDSCNGCGTVSKSGNNTESVTVNLVVGVCAYCRSKSNLLPIPGQKICPTCAQIELGCKTELKNKMSGPKTKSSAGVAKNAI